MQTRKPKAKGQNDHKELDAFISGAEKPPQENAYPWEAETVRPDVTKVFNLRLPEDVFLKLKYLADNQKRVSMQSICLDAIEPHIEAEIERITK